MPLRDSLRQVRRATAVPSLVVGDIAEALAYYRKAFGFKSVHQYSPTAAILRGHGVLVRLQEAPKDQEACRHTEPDAVLLVDRPRRLWRRLDDLGAPLIRPRESRPGSFYVSDPFGNMLSIEPVVGPRAAVKRRIADSLDDVGRRLLERRRAREEMSHLDEFRAFYDRLSDKRDIYYMFFSAGLLHWVLKAASYIPQHVNLVLLGSDLPPDESSWLSEHVDRPFHHIKLRIDDQIAWEFLFAVNRHSFGWVDSDSLVLNSELFGELSQIASDTSLNCAWSWDSGLGMPLANTFLLFVNADAIAAVREQGIRVSPYSYDYEWQNLQIPGRRCYSRIPSRTHRRRLLRILPADESGRPRTPHGMPFFDTTVMYQMLARTCGFVINRVRTLEGFGHIRGLPVQDESTDELLHVGGISKADALDEANPYFHDDQMQLFYLIAESVVLAEVADRLPQYYTKRRDQVIAALTRHDLTSQDAEDMIRRHLLEVRGMSARAVDAVLRGPVGVSDGVAGRSTDA